MLALSRLYKKFPWISKKQLRKLPAVYLEQLIVISDAHSAFLSGATALQPNATPLGVQDEAAQRSAAAQRRG